eukprot:jgi/Picre1/27513/NNA_000480.t1
MTGFGSAQTQQAAGGNVQLLTKDNRPVAHSSKWEDLSPQAQQYCWSWRKLSKSIAKSQTARRSGSLFTSVHELEVTIKDKKRSKAATPDTSVTALQASISNLHDCVMRVAATIQELDDKVQKAKAKALYDIQRKGGASDPFREAAQNETRIRQKDASLLLTKYDDFKSIQNQSMVIPPEAPQPTGIFNTAQNATTPQLLFGRK